MTTQAPELAFNPQTSTSVPEISGEQATQSTASSPETATTENSSTSNSQVADASSKLQAMDERSIEPRSPRRRVLTRIMKKAEWSHLLAELSKVFIRYFLDLALKDMMGKSSGDRASTDAVPTSATTGRKKLETHVSEFGDIFKEFVKTAIANMR